MYYILYSFNIFFSFSHKWDHLYVCVIFQTYAGSLVDEEMCVNLP